MIEGLRLLPYFQETRRNGTAVGVRPDSNNCAACREQLPMESRQDRGCVYEERTAAPQRGYVLSPSVPWRAFDDEGREVPRPPSVCPLYLGRVAEASDVFEALPHFRRGTLDAWLGRAPDRHLLDCLEAYEHGQRTWDRDPNGGAARKAGT